MSERVVRIELDRANRTYEAGDRINGRVEVVMTRDVDCRGVRLKQYWSTHGKGNGDRGPVVESTLYAGPIVADQHYAFPFEVTASEAPFTYHGHFLNVDHYLEANLDLAWARDPGVTEEYIVVPGPQSGLPPETVKQTSLVAVRRAASFGMAVAGAMAMFVGVLTLPLPGVLFTTVGLALFLAGMWRRVARSKLGDAGIHLSSRVVAPGQSVDMHFFFRPRKRTMISGVYAELACKEICVSGSGTDRTTHRHIVTRETTRLAGAQEARGGERVEIHGSIPVPENGAYSFKSADNRVEWSLKLTADIPSWPDWRDQREIVVWPVSEDAEVTSTTIGELPGREPNDLVRRPRTGPLGQPVPDPGWPTDVDWELADSHADVEPVPEPEIAPTASSARRALPADVESASRDAAPSAARLDPMSSALREIASADRFGGARESLVRALIGRAFEFELSIDRAERTFGSSRDRDYRSGRTVIGTTRGACTVAVQFQEVRNEEIDRLERGSVISVRGEVAEWQRLHDRPLLKA